MEIDAIQGCYSREAEVSRLHPAALFEVVEEILTAGQACSAYNKPEACWGEEVIRPLLNLGVKCQSFTGEGLVENVYVFDRLLVHLLTCCSTSVSISPPSLVPCGPGIEGMDLESKRVDYCLFIPLSSAQTSSIKAHLQTRPIPKYSINQTAAPYTQYRPLVASVELKTERSGVDPLVQLAIWTSAGFSALMDLSRTDAAPPAAPVITIVGHEWKIYYVHLDPGSRGEAAPRIMRGPAEFGSTENILGVFKIIRRLGALATYGVEVIWPWIQANILEEVGGQHQIRAPAPY